MGGLHGDLLETRVSLKVHTSSENQRSHDHLGAKVRSLGSGGDSKTPIKVSQSVTVKYLEVKDQKEMARCWAGMTGEV